MTDSVNPNAISILSTDFLFMRNPNAHKKDRYILIFSNVPEFPAKGILSANQIRAVGHFYDSKLHKLGGQQIFVTTDGKEIRMFISDGLSYLLFGRPTNKDIE